MLHPQLIGSGAYRFAFPADDGPVSAIRRCSMSGSYTEGGARPTLTAHSKDGSTRGPTPASAASGHSDSSSDSVMAGGACDTISNAASSAYCPAGHARETVSERGG